MRFPAAVCAITALLAPGCGYRVAGRGDLLPKAIQTIAVPAFENATARYKLTQFLPAAVTREFLSRTRYQIVSDPGEADATLYGAVVNYFSYPTTFDPATGRATGMQMIVVLDLRLLERDSGNMLYLNSGLTIQNRYEISADQAAYFEESDTALARLSADVARSVVSAVLENF